MEGKRAGKLTPLVLADYACVQITELLNGLQDLFANEVNYFGGGCGYGD